MQKPKKVTPISTGHAKSDPEGFTISVGGVPFRLRMGPDGRSTMIGPARLIDFPGADIWKKLAKSAQASDECPDRGNHRARRTKMKTFTIENETNNITLHRTTQEAEAVTNAERFGNEAGLAKLAANWPTSRLVHIWNSLPGATPVKKFKDRPTAVGRIWKAIQSLGCTVPVDAGAEIAPPVETQQEAEVAAPIPETISEAIPLVTEQAAPESLKPDVATPVAPQAPHVAATEPPAKSKATRRKEAPKAAETGAPREGSKTSQVIAMLKRKSGTTLEEIMTAMGWQKHTTRAMLSAGGSLTKKHGLIIISAKAGDKRTYSIKG
jgi:hypothetical protein